MSPGPARCSSNDRAWAVVTGLPCLSLAPAYRHSSAHVGLQMFIFTQMRLCFFKKNVMYAVIKDTWENGGLFLWHSGKEHIKMGWCKYWHKLISKQPSEINTRLAFKKETRAQEVKQLGQEVRCRRKTQVCRFLCWFFSHYIYLFITFWLLFKERYCGLLVLTMWL